MPRKLIPKLPHKEILRYEEILRVVKLGVRLGISKVRVTGGEPLVRRGVFYFLEQLSGIAGLSDISVTTNGVLLKESLEKIKSSGVNRINVSLDTLNKKKFYKITGYDFFDQIWEGIEKASEMNINPIKLNVVPIKGINDDELIEMAKLSFSYPFHIRFIEYMPIGSNQIEADRHLLAPEIKTSIRSLGKLIPVAKHSHDGPAERFRFAGAKGEVGFIRPISRHFCHACNRLRLSASGQLRPCLLSDSQVDLKALIRKGCLDDEIVDALLQAVRKKPAEHHLSINHPPGILTQMCIIGG
jgi:cyclic pyranopterin phosphate synthase